MQLTSCVDCVLKAVSGLPAILVYKKGEVIGNFVRLTDEFGDDMYLADIESFLIEYVYVFDTAVHWSNVRQHKHKHVNSIYMLDTEWSEHI